MNTTMTANADTLTLTTPSDREIVITRLFNSTPEKVFAAWTTPELIRRWYGPRAFEVTVCEVDLQVGGAFRYVVSSAHGDFGFSGKYQEIEPSNRLVYTEGFEAMPGHEATITVTFEAVGGQTKMTSRSVYQSTADRDGHIKSGMEPGMRETLDRLEESFEAA